MELIRTSPAIRHRKSVSGNVSDLGNARAHSTHKKCDAKQPCTTCVSRERGAACTYEIPRSSDNVPPKLPVSPPRVNSEASSPPLNLRLDSGLPRAVLWSDPGPDPFYSPSTNLCERPSTLQLQLEWTPSPCVLDEVVLVLPSDASVVEKAPGATKCPSRPVVSSFTIIPSIHFQTIPNPLRIPLSIIPPNMFRFPPLPEPAWI
jgi:hypothetical protein